MLEVKGLHFSYGKRKMLDDINFQLNSGDFLGILGPNGSGKSTLVKNILKNLNYNEGEICILGKDIKHYSLKELAKIIGLVPQNSHLRVPLKVIDVLLMSKYVNLKHTFSDYSIQDIQEVEQFCKELKLDNFLQRDVLSLSGGEFQRVLLARALLKKPKILFLDEPTSALDLSYAIELLKFCEKLIKKQKISVIAILHDLNLAGMFCNKIIFLKNGKICYQGTVKELFTKEILKEIYNLNCEILYQDEQPYIIALKDEK